MTRIVLAHSGGFETAIAIPWLRERYDAEVVALTLDLGQGGELTDVRERALAAGAVRAHVIDAREEFLREYVLPSLHAGAAFGRRGPTAQALARALVARRVLDVARMEGASAIAYGSGLEPLIRALDPSIALLEPARLWSMSPGQLNEYASAKSVSIIDPATVTAHVNLWGRSVDAPGAELASAEPRDGIYTLTRSPRECPDEPALLEIEFDAGVPVRANGIEMPLVELVESLEIIAGAHGVGRVDLRLDSDTAGARCVAHEAPTAVLLHAAYEDLARFVLPRDLDPVREAVSHVYANLIVDGRWFSPAREALDGFTRVLQRRVTGSVRLKLLKGLCSVDGRGSSVAPRAGDVAVAAGAGVQPAAEGLIS